MAAMTTVASIDRLRHEREGLEAADDARALVGTPVALVAVDLFDGGFD